MVGESTKSDKLTEEDPPHVAVENPPHDWDISCHQTRTFWRGCYIWILLKFLYLETWESRRRFLRRGRRNSIPIGSNPGPIESSHHQLRFEGWNPAVGWKMSELQQFNGDWENVKVNYRYKILVTVRIICLILYTKYNQSSCHSVMLYVNSHPKLMQLEYIYKPVNYTTFPMDLNRL